MLNLMIKQVANGYVVNATSGNPDRGWIAHPSQEWVANDVGALSKLITTLADKENAAMKQAEEKELKRRELRDV